jgi:hypothetical protein
MSLGLKWKEVDAEVVADCQEITNENLAAALRTKRTFTQPEWDSFGIQDLQIWHYIHADGMYFEPDVPPQIFENGKPLINVKIVQEYTHTSGRRRGQIRSVKTNRDLGTFKGVRVNMILYKDTKGQWNNKLDRNSTYTVSTGANERIYCCSAD